MELNGDAFEKDILSSDGVALVDFWAPWCPPCRGIAPIIDELAQEFKGQAQVTKVNVDDHNALAVRYGINNIPTLLFFKDGELVDRVQGAVPKDTLESKLIGLLGADAAAGS
jgi:thioredoxin 1